MEKIISLHKKNIFRQLSHGNESERIFLDKLANEEKIDPVSGEAHYCRSPVIKNLVTYNIKIPRNENFKLLENATDVKVIFQRKHDKYLVIKLYE